MAGHMIDPFKIVDAIRDAPGIYVNNETGERVN
jgi:hypothetical protein